MEKEAYWRWHVGVQSAGGESVRAYCRQQGLSEPSFYAWRRALAKRDAELRVSSESRSVRLSGRARELACAEPSRGAGLIALEIVGERGPGSAVSPTLEIVWPGGPVIRLREDASAEVLQRVLTACRQVSPGEGAAAPAQVRSC